MTMQPPLWLCPVERTTQVGKTAMAVCGSMPAVPEQETNPPATIAWPYGPSAAGAASVETALRVL